MPGLTNGRRTTRQGSRESPGDCCLSGVFCDLTPADSTANPGVTKCPSRKASSRDSRFGYAFDALALSESKGPERFRRTRFCAPCANQEAFLLRRRPAHCGWGWQWRPHSYHPEETVMVWRLTPSVFRSRWCIGRLCGGQSDDDRLAFQRDGLENEQADRNVREPDQRRRRRLRRQPFKAMTSEPRSAGRVTKNGLHLAWSPKASHTLAAYGIFTQLPSGCRRARSSGRLASNTSYLPSVLQEDGLNPVFTVRSFADLADADYSAVGVRVGAGFVF